MGYMVETWVIKDPEMQKEHDEFLLKWFQYVISKLGKSAPNHRYYAMTEPIGGRSLMVEFETKAEMDAVVDPLRVDETFAKYNQEFLDKYVDDPPVVTYWDDLKKEEIDFTLAKVRG